MFKKRGQQEKYKGFFAKNKVWIGATTLMGTVIGAGILGIPYVVAKAGFLLGTLIIIGLGLAFLLLNLFVGEVVLRTKEQHQLTGYAGKYLGKWGKRAMTFSMFFVIYGALTAYLLGEGQTLEAIFGFGNPLIYSLIFFVITALIIYHGIKTTGKAEMVMIFSLLIVIAIIGIFSFKSISLKNLSSFSFAHILIPYGVIIFSYLGSPSIPEIQEQLGKDKKLMKKAIIIGSLVPILIYIIFCVFVIGVVGLENFELLGANEKIATIALSLYSSKILGVFANLVAVLAMFTSYLTLGIALIEVYDYDYGMSRLTSFFLALSFPLIVVLFNLTSFISVLGITGAVAGGLEGIMIVLTYWKAKKLGKRRPEYSLPTHRILGTMLILMFVIGIIYQFL